jgi:exopolysaccharide biosynthesis polyprenyl glycosylphosphotransferase
MLNRAARESSVEHENSRAPAPNVAIQTLRSATPKSSSLRAQVSRRQAVGRIVLLWTASYVIFKPWTSGVDAAVAQATLVALVWLTFIHWAGQLYRAMTFAVGAFAVAGVATFAGVGVVSALNYWVSGVGIKHEPLVLIAFATFFLIGSWDYFVRLAARAPRRILVVGAGPATARLLDDLAVEPESELTVVAIVDDDIPEDLAKRVDHRAQLKNLGSTIRRVSPDLVVIAVQRGRPEVFGELLSAADAGFQVFGLPEIYEFAFGRLPIAELTSAWFMSVLHAYNRPSSRMAKRAFDLAVAVVGIVATLPLLPIIVLLVKRTPGPLLYRQQRLGEHGEIFTMFKFRSMRIDAEVSGEAQWASKNDPRIIPGGRLLRLLRFDELPQFWNVLRGEMSIVGPRPERPEFLEHLEAEVPFWTQRHLLRPGITGWAQIRAAYAADALGTVEKLSYDLWYLRHRSLVLDAVICLKTVPRMITFRGAR